jgi:hypothetical protein
MSQSVNTGGSGDPAAAREALRAELTARGHHVASDTLGLGEDLYVIGPKDLATALFHFDEDAGRLAQSLYRTGAWVEGMPPRFAVLPAVESGSRSFEMLEQMRAIPLLYDVDAGRVSFRELDKLLAENLRD